MATILGDLAGKRMLKGPHTPHWTCGACGQSKNWACRTECLCGARPSDKVLRAAVAAHREATKNKGGGKGGGASKAGKAVKGAGKGGGFKALADGFYGRMGMLLTKMATLEGKGASSPEKAQPGAEVEQSPAAKEKALEAQKLAKMAKDMQDLYGKEDPMSVQMLQRAEEAKAEVAKAKSLPRQAAVAEKASRTAAKEAKLAQEEVGRLQKLLDDTTKALGQAREDLVSAQEKLVHCQQEEQQVRCEQLVATASGEDDQPLLKAVGSLMEGMPQADQIMEAIKQRLEAKKAAEAQKDQHSAQHSTATAAAGAAAATQRGVRQRDEQTNQEAEQESHWKNVGHEHLARLYKDHEGNFEAMSAALCKEFTLRAKKAKTTVETGLS